MNIPSFSTQAVNGRVSWFGGPHDSTDSGHTASGGTTREPGIAIYNRATLGGYWRVTAPNGKTAVVRQTDLGPAPFTGRKIDVTYSALGKFGYNEGNFPTNSEFRATYLGRNGHTPEATSAVTGSAPTPTERPQAGSTTQINPQARRTAENNRILLSMPGGKEFAGLLSTNAPREKTPTQAGGTGPASQAAVPREPALNQPSASSPGNPNQKPVVPPVKVKLPYEKFPALVSEKHDLEKASGHPVTIGELTREVKAGRGIYAKPTGPPPARPKRNR